MHWNLKARYSAGVNQLNSIDVSGAAPTADLTHFFNLITCPSHLFQITSEWAEPYLIHHHLDIGIALQVLTENYGHWERCKKSSVECRPLPCGKCMEQRCLTNPALLSECVYDTPNSIPFFINQVRDCFPQNLNAAFYLIQISISYLLMLIHCSACSVPLQ